MAVALRLAVISQVPTPMTVTVLPSTVQTALLDSETMKVTVLSSVLFVSPTSVNGVTS